MIINEKIKKLHDEYMQRRQDDIDAKKGEVKAIALGIYSMIAKLNDIKETEAACVELDIKRDYETIDSICQMTSIDIGATMGDNEGNMVRYKAYYASVKRIVAVLNLSGKSILIACHNTHRDRRIEIDCEGNISDQDAESLYDTQFADGMRPIDALAAFEENLKIFVDEMTGYYKKLEA